MKFFVKSKVFELPKPGAHNAVVAKAVYLKDNPAPSGQSWAPRDELALTFVITDQKAADGRPLFMWKNITTKDPGQGSYFPVYMHALGVEMVDGLYPVDTDFLVGRTCRLNVAHAMNRKGQTKAKIAPFGIAPPLPGSAKTIVIPAEWSLAGKNNQEADFQEADFPRGDPEEVDASELPAPKAVQSAPAPRYHNVAEMMAAAGVEKTTAAPTDLSTNINAAKAKINGRGPIITSNNALAEEEGLEPLIPF
jgi:hypothetical protein